MKVAVVMLCSILSATVAHAQAIDEKAQVQRALMDYIEGFYEGDSSKIIRSISPHVVKYGYWKDTKSGKYGGEPMSYQEMIDYAVNESKKAKKAKLGALEKTEVYEVQDQTASAKITAWWGTDYILLEKTGNKWMIRMVLWQGPLKK